MKQTAVEWLVEQLPIRIINSYQSEIAKAKKLEKQQLTEAYNVGFLTPVKLDLNTNKSITAEQYYKENFTK